MSNQEAEFYSREMVKYRDRCEELEAKNADLERKLSSIIDDCITENAYEFSQYCQSIDYEYTNQIKELEAQNAKLRECVNWYADVANQIAPVYDPTGRPGADFTQPYRMDSGKRARQVLKKLEPKNEKTQSEKLVDDLNTYAKQALKELDAKKGLREH